MKPLPKKLITIATKARQITEKFAKAHSHIGDVKTLQCYCAIGSRILLFLGNEFGYDVTFVQGHFSDFGSHPVTPATTDINHCWTQYAGRIIDITATQFDISDPVHITSKEDPKYFAIYHHDEFDNQWQQQNPNRYSKSIKMYINHAIKDLKKSSF